jgi:hypothetical protein
MLFLGSTTALMRQSDWRLLSEEGGIKQTFLDRDTIPQSYLNDSTRHKLFLDAGDEAAYSQLLDKNAIIEEIDYGSFRMITVDETSLGGRDALKAMALAVRDDQNLIALNGYVLDTTKPEATLSELPADLRQTDMTDALARGSAPAAASTSCSLPARFRTPGLTRSRTRG